MLEWFGSLFKKESRYDEHLLPMHQQENEPDEELDEIEMDSLDEDAELELAQHVFKEAGGGTQEELNFYFGTFSTSETVFNNQPPVTVWWMSRDHPYVQLLRAKRAQIWKLHKKTVLIPFKIIAPNVYAYTEDTMEKAVEYHINLCSKFNLIKIHEEEPVVVTPESIHIVTE